MSGFGGRSPGGAHAASPSTLEEASGPTAALLDTPSATPSAERANHRRRPGAAPRLAFLAGQLPKRSETFVTQEWNALESRGWAVVPVTLHHSPDANSPELRAAAERTWVAYDSWPAIFGRVMTECATHPLRSFSTLLLATLDAALPGEQLALTQRAKLVAQAIAAIALARRLRRDPPAHVHCHFAHAPTTVGMYLAHQLGIEFSFTGHANDLFDRRQLLRTKLRRASFVSCISQWHRSWYQSLVERSADHYPIIRCGVDLEQWPRRRQRDTDLDQPPHLVTIGRLVRKKGTETFLRAAALVRAELGDLSISVAGDGPEAENLKRLARELELDVRFLGSVAHAEVAPLLREADLFVLPSRVDERDDRDGIPVVLMEAMAAGVPAVTTDLPAFRELITDGRSGRLLPLDAPPPVVAGAMAAILQDPSLAQRWAIEARARVETEFSLSENVERLEQALTRRHPMTERREGAHGS